MPMDAGQAPLKVPFCMDDIPENRYPHASS